MAFLNFMKKREELPADIDFDIPPEPPKMMKEEIAIEEPIDEELMPKAKPKKLKEKIPEVKKEKLPELPPLPKEEELGPLPELFSLPEEKPGELGETEIPPPPEFKKEKKGFFSFLKLKKKAKEFELPEMPSLPEVKEEEIKGFPEIPSLPEIEEAPLPEEKPIAPPIEPLKPVVEEPVPEVKEAKLVEKPIKRFITINDFKQIQGDIRGMRGVLKDVDGFLVKLEEVRGSGDREYAGLYSSLKDIQTKIMFVDKSLFKGEV